MAKNVEITVEDEQMHITIDLSERFGLSTSGKSQIVASTEGNVSVPGHDGMMLGLNVYEKQ